MAATWRALSPEQRVAGVGSMLLIVSTFGPFSFVEAAIALVGLGILLLLRQRARGKEFHLPFGDGAVIALAGVWCAFLILVRVFDRPLGQNLLALACAAILLGAGVRERARRPADDLRAERAKSRQPPDWLAESGRAPGDPEARTRRLADEGPTEPLDQAATRPLGDERATRPLDEGRSIHGEQDEASTSPLSDQPPERLPPSRRRGARRRPGG